MIAEATVDEFILPNEISKDVFMHLKYKYESPFWCKENLINLAVNKLTSSNLNWQYVAWIDADISFLNTNWVQHTIQELKKAHFVQLFKDVVYLGPTNEVLYVRNGFSFIYYLNNFKRINQYSHVATGLAIACTRWAFENTQGLIDFNIVGGGDSILMMSIVQHLHVFLVDKVTRLNISSTFVDLLREKQSHYRQFGIKLSFLTDAILSHWHGTRADRNYMRRWNILKDYNPVEDLIRNSDGLLNLNENGKRMKFDFIKYFLLRNDDNLNENKIKVN